MAKLFSTSASSPPWWYSGPMLQMLMTCCAGGRYCGVPSDVRPGGGFVAGRGVGVGPVGTISARAGAGPRDSAKITSAANTGTVESRASLFIAPLYVRCCNSTVNMRLTQRIGRALSFALFGGLGLSGQATLFTGRSAGARRLRAGELEALDNFDDDAAVRQVHLVYHVLERRQQ